MTDTTPLGLIVVRLKVPVKNMPVGTELGYKDVPDAIAALGSAAFFDVVRDQQGNPIPPLTPEEIEEAQRAAQRRAKSRRLILGADFDPLWNRVDGIPSAEELEQMRDDVEAVADVPPRVEAVEGTVTTLQVAQGGTYHIDTYPSVQAALTAAGNAGGGRVVGDPAKTYAQTTTLTVPANVTLSGVTLTFTGTPNATNDCITLNGAGASIEDCTITVSSGPYARCVAAMYSDTKMRRNRIHWASAAYTAQQVVIFRGQGQDTNILPGIEIDGNEVTVSAAHSIQGVGAGYCPGIRVVNNHFHDWTGIVDPTLGWVVYVFAGCYGAIVGWNRVERVPTKGLRFANQITDGLDLDHGRRMVGNVIVEVLDTALSVTEARGQEISGNTILRSGVLRVEGRENIVHHNHIEDFRFGGNDPDRPMVAILSDDTVVSGNVIGQRGEAYTGIIVYGSRVEVVDTVMRPNRPRNAIRWMAGADDGIVRGGIIAASDDATGGDGIRTDAANTTIDGVRVSATAASNFFGVRVSGPGCTVRNSHFIGGSRGIWNVTAGVGTRLIDNTFTGQATAEMNLGGTVAYLSHTGTGAPTLAVGDGSVWRRTDGAAGSTFYIREGGEWVPK